MTHSISIRHNFEAAHRLPHLGRGKCYNLHGHSWWTEIEIGAPGLAADGTVVEFGSFKAAVRGWIDTHLDHAAMLGQADRLAMPLLSEGVRLYLFRDSGVTAGLAWPTVENVATLLARICTELLTDLTTAPGASLTGVLVRETHVNSARWTP